MTKRMKSIVALVATTAFVSACNFSNFDREIGSDIDEGEFGNPTMNNIMIHSGQISYAIQLGQRFTQEVPDTVNFAFNSAVLDGAAQETLRRQAHWIRQFPEIRFKVFGHTDLVGSDSYNKALGMRRAQTVVSYLASQGVSRSRLEAVVSYGKTRPVIQTQSEERANRRTVTEVSGFVSNHPAVVNGKYMEIVHREYLRSARPLHPTISGTQSEVAGSD
jgi:outer membrane protein OmpA-like peptidoglycan-associated protein